MGKGIMPGSQAKRIARAQEAQPKMPRQAPAGGKATPLAKKPQAAEMGSGGLKKGINTLKKNHAMSSRGGMKMV